MTFHVVRLIEDFVILVKQELWSQQGGIGSLKGSSGFKCLLSACLSRIAYPEDLTQRQLQVLENAGMTSIGWVYAAKKDLTQL